MEAAVIVSLIQQVGLPLALKLIDLAMKGGKVTPEEWAALKQENAATFDSLCPKRSGV